MTAPGCTTAPLRIAPGALRFAPRAARLASPLASAFAGDAQPLRLQRRATARAGACGCGRAMSRVAARTRGSLPCSALTLMPAARQALRAWAPWPRA